MTGSGNSNGTSSDSDKSGAERPEKKEARKTAINATLAEQAATRSKYKSLAMDYRKYTEAFREWSKRKDRGHDRKEISKLMENINKLLLERSPFWSENQEDF